MWSHNKYLIFIIILITVIFGLFFLAIYPAVSDIRISRDKIEAEYSRLKELLEKGQGIEKAQENFTRIGGQIAATERVFLKTGGELDFITELERIAEQNEVEQEISLAPKEASKASGFETVPLSLNASGAIGNILAYINDLEKMNYYINFHELDISAAGIKKSSKLPPVINTGPESREDNQLAAEQINIVNLKIAGVTFWK